MDVKDALDHTHGALGRHHHENLVPGDEHQKHAQGKQRQREPVVAGFAHRQLLLLHHRVKQQPGQHRKDNVEARQQLNP